MASKINDEASNPKPQTSARTCLCSPTTHPGSFRCSLHRNSSKVTGRSGVYAAQNSTNRWESKMIVKASCLKEFLLQIIKPSSHDLKRRRNFQPRPTRFSLMNSSNGNGVAVS